MSKFSELRSLLHSPESDGYVLWKNLVEVCYDLYSENPQLFLGEYVRYIEDHLLRLGGDGENAAVFMRKGVLIPRSIYPASIYKIREIFRNSSFFRELLIGEVSVIGNYSFNYEHIETLLEFSANFSGVSFRHVQCDEIRIDLGGIIGDRDSFQNIQRLEVIDSDWNILQSISSNGKLDTVCVGSDYRTDGDLNIILEEVLESNSIKHLKLTHLDNLDIGRLLPYVNGLESLEIYASRFGDRGAIVVSNSDNFKDLKVLKLDACRIGDEGVTALAEAFDERMTSLERFSLYQNNFRYYQRGGAALLRSRLGELYDPEYYKDYDCNMNS